MPHLVAADMLRHILPRWGDGRPGGHRWPASRAACAMRRSKPGRDAATAGAGPPNRRLREQRCAASRADLFINHRVILTPEAGNDPAAVALVRAMGQYRRRGGGYGRDEHDAVLAATSHLPHVLAYALVDALAQSPASVDIFASPPAASDFTRIASSDPAMWRDIALANRRPCWRPSTCSVPTWGSLRQAVVEGDAEQLFATFTRAKQAGTSSPPILAARPAPTLRDTLWSSSYSLVVTSPVKRGYRG